MKIYHYQIQVTHVNAGMTRSLGSVEASSVRVAVQKSIHNDPVFGIGAKKRLNIQEGDLIKVFVWIGHPLDEDGTDA